MKKVVGSGKFVFEAIEGWGQLPPDFSYEGQIPGLALDSQDRVYVFTRGKYPVIIFDRTGRFLGSWGEGMFTRPHGLCIGPDETIYCVDDEGNAIRQFTLDGKPLSAITVAQPSPTGYKPGYPHSVARSGPPFCYPTDLALSAGGDIYVSDGYGNARIHRYSPDGKLSLSWGQPGNGPGEFVLPHGLCIDKAGQIYVADRENKRIQVFSPEGEFITQWTDVYCPNKMVIDDEENMYVAEMGLVVQGDADHPQFFPDAPHGRITVRNLSGDILAEWGALDPMGTGLYYAPHCMGLDFQKNLYVGEVAGSYSRGRAAHDKPVLNKYVRL